MGGHPLALEQLKQQGRNPAIEGPLTGQLGLLEGIEGGGVVLEFHRHQIALVGLENPLCLALMEQGPEAVAGHGWLVTDGDGAGAGAWAGWSGSANQAGLRGQKRSRPGGGMAAAPPGRAQLLLQLLLAGQPQGILAPPRLAPQGLTS